MDDLLDDLRAGWRDGASASLTVAIPGTTRTRLVVGKITQVAVTGVYVIVGGVHVPTSTVKSWVVRGGSPNADD